jgi:hypothetical protein
MVPAGGGGSAVTAPSPVIEVVVPTGAVSKLQKALRTQSAVPPSDFTVADLQNLVIQLDGRTLAPSEYTITSLQYDPHQQLVVTITFTPPPTKPTPVRVATTDGAVMLLGLSSANADSARIDQFSTADALMAQLLVQPQTEDERRLCREAIAKTITDGLTASDNRPLTGNAALQGLMQRLSAYIANGRPLTEEALAMILTPPSSGGGGASCFEITQFRKLSEGGDSEGSTSGGDPSTSGGGSSGGPMGPPGEVGSDGASVGSGGTSGPPPISDGSGSGGSGSGGSGSDGSGSSGSGSSGGAPIDNRCL